MSDISTDKGGIEKLVLCRKILDKTIKARQIKIYVASLNNKSGNTNISNTTTLFKYQMMERIGKS